MGAVGWETLQAPVEKVMHELEERLAHLVPPSSPLHVALERLVPGGKRLRPLLVLLASEQEESSLLWEKRICLAVAIELVHIATLAHDDIVDDAPLRRGRGSVQAVCGVEVALQSGDFLFGKAMLLFQSLNVPAIEQNMASTVHGMCEGELMQWAMRFSLPREVLPYLRRVRRKTALLIASSCRTGALLAQRPAVSVRALTQYGRCLGMAFQLADDALDWQGKADALGKPILQDLQQGHVTLPVFYAWQQAPVARREMIVAYLQQQGTHAPSTSLLEWVQESGGVEKTRALAQAYAEKACTVLLRAIERGILSSTPAIHSLLALAQQVVSRTD